MPFVHNQAKVIYDNYELITMEAYETCLVDNLSPSQKSFARSMYVFGKSTKITHRAYLVIESRP